jgi:hypothetical protein
MKNNMMKFLWVIVFILGPLIISLAQPIPPTPDSNDPTLNCGQGAPIGNGYWILLALAFSYGAYKAWEMHKAEKTVSISKK